MSDVIDGNLAELTALSSEYKMTILAYEQVMHDVAEGKPRSSDVVAYRSDLRRISARVIHLLSVMHRDAIVARVGG